MFRRPMRWVYLIGFALAMVNAHLAVAQSSPHVHPNAHANETGTAKASSSWDVFTNYGNYLPRTHCLLRADGTPDWPWIIFSVVANVGVLSGYILIFRFWRRSYTAEAPADRNKKLMYLAWIFLLCAISGYLMPIVMVVWPAYRLQVLFMCALTVVTWQFAWNITDLRASFSAFRVQREFEESLKHRAVELERLVSERTAQLESARQEAMAANEAKSLFVAHMSHEIRTPLTAMLGYAALVDDATITNAQRHEAVATVRDSGQHLLNVINDILDLSKIEAGRLEIVPQPTLLKPCIEETFNLFSVRAKENGNVMRLTMSPDLPERVVIDAMRLRQILANLISNAVKFTHNGFVDLFVNYEHTPTDMRLQIIVRDAGAGITPDVMAQLFRPFSQGDASMTRVHGGTGLGLAICRRLCELMGGNINATSTPGQGATFTVSLAAPPAFNAVTQEDSKIESPTSNNHTETTTNTNDLSTLLKGRHVLLADDHLQLRKLTEIFLKKGGATVTAVSNGQEMLDHISANASTYDLILLDMQMPVLDGYTTASRLREQGFSKPIVAFTAHALESERKRCLDAGCSHCVTKPVELEQLLKQLHAALGE